MAVEVRPDQFTTITPLDRPRFDVRSDLRSLDLAFEQLQPPPTLWVTPDDIIEVGVRNSLTGVTIRATSRILLADGGVSLIQQDIRPIADRSLNYFAVPLGYGYLLSAAAYSVGSTTPRRGQTYVSLQLVRPPTSSFVIDQPMGADYVAGSNFVGWPFGRILGATEGTGFLSNVSATTPAAGVDWSITVPTNARWYIRSVRGLLTTSAAAGTRTPGMSVTIGGVFGPFIPGSAAIGAGVARGIDWLPDMTTTPFSGGEAGQFLIPDFHVPSGAVIASLTDNLAVGDQWSNIRLTVEEVLED